MVNPGATIGPLVPTLDLANEIGVKFLQNICLTEAIPSATLT